MKSLRSGSAERIARRSRDAQVQVPAFGVVEHGAARAIWMLAARLVIQEVLDGMEKVLHISPVVGKDHITVSAAYLCCTKTAEWYTKSLTFLEVHLKFKSP